MKIRTVISGIALLMSVSSLSACVASTAESVQTLDYDIKDGYYLSDTDDSYLHISEGYIELVGYDITPSLRKAYDDGVEEGLIDPEADTFEEFEEVSIADSEERAAPRPYKIAAFPEMNIAMVATEWYETEDGIGSCSGYTIIDDTTLSAHDMNYVYAGETIS